MKLNLHLHRSSGGLWDAVLVLSCDNSTGQRRPRDHSHTCVHTMITEQQEKGRLTFDSRGNCTPTYFVVELWKLSFHFLSLEEMILSLLTHRRN